MANGIPALPPKIGGVPLAGREYDTNFSRTTIIYNIN